MQILRSYRALYVATFALAALSTRAADTTTQTPPPPAASPQTISNLTAMVRQAEADAAAKEEAEKKAAKGKFSQATTNTLAAKEPATKAKAEKAKSGQATTNAPVVKKGVMVKPIEGPPLPISADKDQRLQELLKRYKADQLTPEQYQTERAKILAEP
jgi:hypothetical protein